MIAIETAQQLRDAGLRWDPAAGDRFVITDPRIDDEVYVVSDMTVDVHRFASGTVLGFNGTTEWALDSVEQRRALWLPREGQLRALLGNTFHSLARTEAGWQVDLAVAGKPTVVVDLDPERAYARALLILVVGEEPGTDGAATPSG